LLQNEKSLVSVLDLLDFVTASILDEKDKKSDDYRVLRKSLGYTWSVVVAAHPELGKPRMEKWIKSEDQDIRWIMKKNLKKNRLNKMDPEWAEAQSQTLSE
jgi:hypothetical protein